MKSTTVWLPKNHWPLRWLNVIALAVAFDVAAQDSAPTNSAAELKRLSLEDLMNQEVMIVSRREERLAESPSAVQVISAEDIHASGATTLPEALRLAANLQVAQIDSHQWAISARGFNTPSGIANKLLVMIDRRTVYTPLFAGVFWDVQFTPLEDIDRIEVVSGPGGSLWGANAVNGVINIVTKRAKDTQGVLVEGGGGSFLQDFGVVRYGGHVGTNTFFRVYGQRFDHNSSVFSDGRDGTNSWDMTQGGFRLDYQPSDVNTITVQGDVYSGSIEGPTNTPTTVDGQNVVGRWNHNFSDESDLTVQMYLDRTWRRIPGAFAEDLRTYDVDFEHRFALGSRNTILWGAGYRLMWDEVRNSSVVAFLPSRRNLQLVSAFVQDEIMIVPDQLRLTIGTRLEHNDYSGLEVQPSVRLAWMPAPRHTFWGAISRAVRSPSRIDTDFFAPGSPPFVLAGGTNFTSEKLLAYELGYRVRPAERLSISLATFYNAYDDVRSVELNGGTAVIQNGLKAQSWGAELSGEFQATDWWRWRGGYTYFHKDVWQQPGHTDLSQARGEGNDPTHQVVVQTMFNLPCHLELDLTGRYVDRLPTPQVPSYFSFDAQLSWRACNNLELSVVGQNLNDSRHPEFGAAGSRQEIPRSVYGKVTWRF